MPSIDSKENLIIATGRRKTSTARVFLYPEKGDIFVNDIKIDDYYTKEIDRLSWKKPFHTLGIPHPLMQFRGTIKVEGSGRSSQLGAVVHALSRALAKYNEEYRKILRRNGFMTRDPRMVERKKYYLRKARKAPQYSKR
ncbi:30S ribosomal protein S9 [candidate division WWE3 bacterium RBG_19FT_COMBO_34_6]|uniref:Small ribosomal subunit protein uS9 n=1 Tax=candidate division WWE3 bacterium RBG_19FT_COMBO_34_6 TaxID=1802612 RepID=A0A1F4UNN9_UNCKA|nr:MAG: 30S ribosomal protein S9 [candidate division WWE3 bacterium RBG_19FT_COMBO_34_6]